MKSFKLHFRNWMVAAFALFSSANALATVVYTTFPGPAGGGWCFGGAGYATATGVHTPTGSGYTLDSISARLQEYNGAGDPFAFDLYDDNGGVPGNLIASIGTGTGHSNGTTDIYTVIPNSPIPLSADTTYWIVVSSSSNVYCTLTWSDTGTNPAGGIFNYVGEEFHNSSSWNNENGSYQQLEINATSLAAKSIAQPIPTLSQWDMIMLSSLLALGAFFFLRRLRRQ
jgi:hypothetical protein